MKISNIIIHHSGGLGNDNFASTANLTPQSISNYHKSRWNFKSKFINDGPNYAGYNFIYDPKNRKFTQCRAIGEETAHTIGQNLSSVGICIIGNYNFKKLSKTETVDVMFTYMVEDMVSFLLDLINGNKRDCFVAPGTELILSKNRIYPHSFFSQTQCYGTGIDSNFFTEKVFSYKEISPPEDLLEPNIVVKENDIIKEIKLLIALLLKFFTYVKIGAGKINRAGSVDREDPDNFNQ